MNSFGPEVYSRCDKEGALSLTVESKTAIIVDAAIIRRRVEIRNSLRSVFERLMRKNGVDFDTIIDEEMEIVLERASEIFEQDKNSSLVGAIDSAKLERSELNDAEVWFEEFAKHVAARMKRMILNDQCEQALDYYGFMQKGQYESTLVVMQREAARTVKKEVARMIKCRENGNAVRSIFLFGGVTGVTISDLQKLDVDEGEMVLFRESVANVLAQSLSEHPFIYWLERNLMDELRLMNWREINHSMPVQLAVKSELLKSATTNNEWFEQLCDLYRSEGLMNASTERNHRSMLAKRDYLSFDEIKRIYETAMENYVRKHPHFEPILREMASRH